MSEDRWSRVWSHEPMKATMPNGVVSHAVNTVIEHDGRRVSIACNDSCGAFDSLSRSDILCLEGDDDVSVRVLGPREEHREGYPWSANKHIKAAVLWLFEERDHANHAPLVG